MDLDAAKKQSIAVLNEVTKTIKVATPEDIKTNLPGLKIVAEAMYLRIAQLDKSRLTGFDDLRSAALKTAETIETHIGENVNHHGVSSGSNTGLIIGVVGGVVQHDSCS